MIKKLVKKINDAVIYCLCVLFVFSSLCKLISYTFLDIKINNNDTLYIIVFVMIILASFILGKHLNRLFLMFRLPVSEWKGFLK